MDACDIYNPAVAEALSKKPVSAPAPAAAGGDAPGEDEEAERLMSKARTYESSRMWGKALDGYQDVIKKFPGIPQAKEAKEAVTRIEALLAGQESR